MKERGVDEGTQGLLSFILSTLMLCIYDGLISTIHFSGIVLPVVCGKERVHMRQLEGEQIKEGEKTRTWGLFI